MCGGRKVILRADSSSPVGDTLSPALSLIVPNFIRSASFEKYIVAYFDDVCSEEDVPSPFMITVRYKLMKQFEEVFFRILDTEKHEPGRVKYIKGISEDEYLRCPSGRALKDAIKAFHAYQLENRKWFEDELLESSEFEAEETTAEISASSESTPSFTTPHSVRQESDLIQDETIEFQMRSLGTWGRFDLTALFFYYYYFLYFSSYFSLFLNINKYFLPCSNETKNKVLKVFNLNDLNTENRSEKKTFSQ